jgi:hypothetical protein
MSQQKTNFIILITTIALVKSVSSAIVKMSKHTDISSSSNNGTDANAVKDNRHSSISGSANT